MNYKAPVNFTIALITNHLLENLNSFCFLDYFKMKNTIILKFTGQMKLSNSSKKISLTCAIVGKGRKLYKIIQFCFYLKLF